jgi:hypothetical protein
MVTNMRRSVKIMKQENKIAELKPCPFCGKEIDAEKNVYIPERDWAPSFYDPDSGGKSNSHSL